MTLNLQEIIVQPVQQSEQDRFQSLMQAHHYLGALPKIGHTRYGTLQVFMAAGWH